MKIAFAGTSGSGKTTLATWLAKEMELPYISGSSGDLKNLEDKEYLKAKFGFEGNAGHSNVIQESHKNPMLGFEIQRIVRRRRSQLIRNNPEFVTDRSPIDNWVYFMMQSGIYQSEAACGRFLEECYISTSHLDYLIYVPSLLNVIEDNGSRVANIYVQKMVDSFFDSSFKAFQKTMDRDNRCKTKLIVITMQDLQKRKDYLLTALGKRDKTTDTI